MKKRLQQIINNKSGNSILTKPILIAIILFLSLKSIGQSYTADQMSISVIYLASPTQQNG